MQTINKLPSPFASQFDSCSAAWTNEVAVIKGSKRNAFAGLLGTVAAVWCVLIHAIHAPRLKGHAVKKLCLVVFALSFLFSDAAIGKPGPEVLASEDAAEETKEEAYRDVLQVAGKVSKNTSEVNAEHEQPFVIQIDVVSLLTLFCVWRIHNRLRLNRLTASFPSPEGPGIKGSETKGEK